MRTALPRLLLAALASQAVACTAPATLGGLLGRDAGDDVVEGIDSGAPAHADGGRSCDQRGLDAAGAPLGLLLVVDDDASLATWWSSVSLGIGRFLEARKNDALEIGLQRFTGVCDSTMAPAVAIGPVAVTAADIPPQLPARALVTNSVVPGVRASLETARAWSEANGNARVAVVLLTDASPGPCDNADPDYGGTAEEAIRLAAQDIPPVATYVIQLGTLPTPERLARGGGTELRALGVSTSDVAVEAALHSVVESARGCP